MAEPHNGVSGVSTERTEERHESKVEVIKRESRYLRGTLKEALVDGQPKFSEENVQVLKFHGVYQQDDRDLRAQLKKEGKDRHWIMMVRARIPGGVLTADQYLAFDDIASRLSEYGSLRITTRQTIQLHGIVKDRLKETIREINDALVTTLGGCGDQVRNIICCPAPGDEPFRREMREDLLALVARLGAKTGAYHEIWLDGEPVELAPGESEEPLYGDVYLPRKFKVAIAPEGDNCIDVYDNDVGLVAHLEEGRIVGYTVLVGGSMGRTASDPNTYPRLASPLAYIPRHEVVEVVTAIVTVQRDFGDRANRRFARLKYTIDRRGLDWMRSEVEARLGRPLAPPRTLVWTNADDHLGWHREAVGRSYLGLFVPQGRVVDTEAVRLKSGLRQVVERFRPTVRLTPQQNVLLSGIPDEARQEVEACLREFGVRLADEWSLTRRRAMACVALPTCGLAVAESERVLPAVVAQFEPMFEALGLADEGITIRVTGCPNGCARPYNANIALVGRTMGKYDVFLGGSEVGTALNERFREVVPLAEVAEAVRPVLEAFAAEREPGEAFGDFVRRVGLERFRAEPVRA
ncbi:NADPH-dependent assimilatory sulfite reductase hemoprotein subunit [Alicyclobacillus sp.]|uniref:NADPH-dependent assimilatory sulfite reductase hemoprotein subunit n=1 Tax=Alicyclobacillus sp. TaxID=61169 RepID=UPI0025BF8B76|nr:NADPH-dependent assimilatory sulfite reductase hemoprotein subunit [Alicyclobacillus sp.]